MNIRGVRRLLSIGTRTSARIRRDVDEELALHIEQRADILEQAGLSRDEARARAEREFGDLEDAASYCADLDERGERRRQRRTWLDELKQDALHAVRLLRRAPAFAAATIVTLGVGVGASTAVYGVLHTYLVRPLPFPEPDRIMAITPPEPRNRNERGPSLDRVDWKLVEPLFQSVAMVDVDGFTLLGEAHAENADGAWVSPGFFDVLGLRPAMGRAFTGDDYANKAPVMLISHRLWTRRFHADSSVVGSTVRMYPLDRPTMMITIVGVLPETFWPMHWRDSDILLPLTSAEDISPWMVRLRRGDSPAAVAQQLNAVVKPQLGNSVDAEWRLTLTAARDRHSAFVERPLSAVSYAALFMLLAACGSVAGALVSRMAARRGELALRLALGGSRARIVRQLLTEAGVLALLAGLLGVAIAYALLATGGPLVEQQLGTAVPGGVNALRPTAAIILRALATSGILGVALGLIPAATFLRSGRLPNASLLRGTAHGYASRGAGRLVRRVLIATQVTVATVLLFGAGLMFRSIARMNALRLGFDPNGIVKGTMFLPQTQYRDSAAKRLLMERVLDRLDATDAVISAAAVFPHPFRGGGAGRFPVLSEGASVSEETAPRAGVHTISARYFETMRIRLVRGRAFTASDDHAAPLVVIVSERLAAQLAPHGNAIGKRIRVRAPLAANFNDQDDRPWRTIVGVVADTRKTFGRNEPPDVFIPYAQNPRAYVSIVVRTDTKETAVAEPVRRAVASIDPTLALSDVEPLVDVIAALGGPRRGLTVLLGAFAIFAMMLSALGLYASLAYTVVQRRAELALRVAIGADRSSILGLILGEGLLTAAIGIGLGVLASLALGRVIASQVYEIGPRDPGTLVGIAVVLAATAVAACLVPGIRATRTDPALALRE